MHERIQSLTSSVYDTAGKSTFINNLARKQVAFSRNGLATMCPVIYQLRRGPEAFSFNGQSVTLSELFTRAGEWMDKFDPTKGASQEALIVTIWSPDYTVEMDLVDTPGLTAETVEGGTFLQSTLNIVSKYMTGM
jgi:hypothetical protein